MVAYTVAEMPKFNPVNICSYHLQEAGATPVQEVAYALATLHPRDDFDLYPDTRDQMYGGIRAERDETNLAIGATAGQVLTYGGRPIVAYYFSTSGGRTSAVQDAWPHASPAWTCRWLSLN